MTPPAAATAAARSDARTSAPPRRPTAVRSGPIPRRVSGPKRDRRDNRATARTRINTGRADTPARPHFRLRGVAGLGMATGAGAIALPARGIRAAARTIPEGTGVVDRVLRGRGIIAVVAALLIGLVFLQVSLLKLNAGIGRDVQAATTYERENASLQADINGLTASGRVTAAALKQGMVAPNPDQVRYLNADHPGGVGGAGGPVLARGSVDPSTGAPLGANGDPITTDPNTASDPGTSTDPAASTDPTSAGTGAGTAVPTQNAAPTQPQSAAQPTTDNTQNTLATATGAAMAPTR